MKLLKKLIPTYFILLIVLMLLLFFSCLIPQKNIEQKVKESASYMTQQGEDWFVKELGRKIRQDNDTDAIMINIAYSIDENNVFYSMLAARRNYVKNVTTHTVSESEGDLKFDGKKFNMIRELKDTTNKKNIKSFPYFKYWHGYLTIIRPLLVFFNIKQIRTILTIISLILLIILSINVYRKTNIYYALSIFIGYISFDFFAWFNILQGMFAILISLVAGIIVSSKNMKKDSFNTFLFIIGGLTSFFDFLTFPLVSLLMPILIRYIVYNDEENNKEKLKKVIINLICSIAGYALIWVSKWIISDIIYNTNVIKVAITEVLYRTGLFPQYDKLFSKDMPNYLFFNSLTNNILYSINYLTTIISFMFLFIFVKLSSERKILESIKKLLVPFILSIIVILWYIIISQHSWYHFYFTYKNMIIIYITKLLFISNQIINLKNRKNMLK